MTKGTEEKNPMGVVAGLLQQMSLADLTRLTKLAESELYNKQYTPLLALVRLLGAMPKIIVYRPLPGKSLLLGFNQVGNKTPVDCGNLTEIVATCLEATGWSWQVQHTQSGVEKWINSRAYLRPMPEWMLPVGSAMAEDNQETVSGSDLYDYLVNKFNIKNPPPKQDSILPADPTS